MAASDDDETKKLELPSLGSGLGFRRRRKGAEADASVEEPSGDASVQAPTSETADPEPEVVEPAVVEPEVVEPEVVEPEVVEPEVVEPEVVEPGSTELGEESDEPDLDEPVSDPASGQDTEDEPEFGTLFPAAARRDEALASDGVVAGDDVPAEDDVAVDEGPERAPRRPLRLPRVDPRVAAGATGLLVGLTGVFLVWVFGQGCDVVKGSGSCGGALGLLGLVVVLVGMVVAGSTLLRAWGQPDSTSASLLGVGLIAVVVMLFLLPVVDEPLMVVVVPLLGAAAYVLSWYVSTGFGGTRQAEERTDDREPASSDRA